MYGSMITPELLVGWLFLGMRRNSKGVCRKMVGTCLFVSVPMPAMGGKRTTPPPPHTHTQINTKTPGVGVDSRGGQGPTAALQQQQLLPPPPPVCMYGWAWPTRMRREVGRLRVANTTRAGTHLPLDGSEGRRWQRQWQRQQRPPAAASSPPSCSCCPQSSRRFVQHPPAAAAANGQCSYGGCGRGCRRPLHHASCTLWPACACM